MPSAILSSSARILAPVALAICAVAVLDRDRRLARRRRRVVRGETRLRRRRDHETTDGDDAGEALASGPTRSRPATRSAAIAETTGRPVDTLQELNPELDPQALIAGQKIQLR